MLLFILFTFGCGLMLGSFMNAWAWRVQQGRTIVTERSECPRCRHVLAPGDLVPLLSYMWLHGRCRYCRALISVQYPAVELVTGTLFAASAWYVWTTGLSLAAPLWWIATVIVAVWAVVALCVGLFVYDLKHQVLPDIWTFPAGLILLTLTVAAAMTRLPPLWRPDVAVNPDPDPLPALIAALAAAAFFALIILGTRFILGKEGMGWGDVKLAVPLGLLLGYPGIVAGLYLAFILGAVLSLALIATKRRSREDALPFGPFLLVGALAAYWATPLFQAWLHTYL